MIDIQDHGQYNIVFGRVDFKDQELDWFFTKSEECNVNGRILADYRLDLD